MAKVTKLVDDIDGTDADRTETFGIGGVIYQIDLSDGNAKALLDALAPYVDKAQKVGKMPKLDGGATAPVKKAAVAAEDKAHLSEMREWLKANGYGPLPPRLSTAQVEAYNTRTPLSVDARPAKKAGKKAAPAALFAGE